MRAALLLVLAAAAAAAQPPPPGRDAAAGRRVAVVYRDGLPTERRIVEALRRILPAEPELIRSEPVEAAVERLRRIDGEGFEVVVALGRNRALLAIEHVRAARLVLGGGLGAGPEGLPERRGAAPAPSLHPLDADPDEVARARTALLPEVRRIAVVSPAGPWSGLAPAVLATPWGGSVAPEAFVAALRPQVDALMIPEDESLLAVAGALVDAARRARLPVITTSPWLARSGAVLGVVPDLDIYATQLAARVRGASSPGPPVRPPFLRLLDRDALRDAGLPGDALRLARADLVIDGRTGSSP